MADQMSADVPVSADAELNAKSRKLSINFSIDSTSERFKLAGWSRAAEDGSRTLGMRSTLRIPRPKIPDDYLMTIRLKPFALGDIVPHHRLSILVNDQKMMSIVVRTRTEIDVWIPWDLIAEEDDFVVEFDLPDAERPSALRESTDNRLLALVLRSITLQRLVLAHQRVGVTRDLAQRYKELMLHFTSLGENCEVGLLQRMCGAEPLGLFRFAATPIDSLTRALQADFEGLGSADQTVIYHSTNGEYLVRDRRYDLRWHTGVRIANVPEDVVAVQQQQRLRYLGRKMIEDVRRGETIFVYRSDNDVERADVQDLFVQLRRHGQNTLLWVVEEAPGPRGRAYWLEPGLMKGNVDRLARTDIEKDISFQSWVGVFERALRIWKKRHPAAASDVALSGRPRALPAGSASVLEQA